MNRVPEWPAENDPEQLAAAEAAFQALLPPGAVQFEEGIYAVVADVSSSMASSSEITNTGGFCLCGGVQYLLECDLIGSAGQVCYCHCSMCRHAIGVTGAAAIAVPDKHLKLTSSKTLKHYQSRHDTIRSFCNECGCSIIFKYSGEPNTTWIYAATLNDAFQNSLEFEQFMNDPTKACHIYTSNRPTWVKTKENEVALPSSKTNEAWIEDSCKE